jgi:hypothetical protein
MNYKETLFFVGQSLTINNDPKNKVLIEEKLKSKSVDWEAVVKVSTAHFVLPALYCNYKRGNLICYLPEDLVAFMVHITDLNRERNRQIVAQAKEINELLLANHITPIFLKGTGNLLEGLYEDIAERMVGDMDFIVAPRDYLKTVEVLKNNHYKPLQESEHIRKFHWHYPRLVHAKKIGAVEVHNKILKKPFDYLLHHEVIKEGLIKKLDFHFLSSSNKILNAILPKIINDNLYYSKNFSLRTMYDVFLISRNSDYKINIKSTSIFKKFNNFCGCIQMVLNSTDTIKVQENKTLKKFKNSYLLGLDNSKTERIKSKIMDYLIRYRGKLYILKMSFSDQEYRNFILNRIIQIDFYKSLIGIRPNR